MADTHSLRPEAFPVVQWNTLTDDQKLGLARLLRMLKESIQLLDSRSGQVDTQLPWLLPERHTQLAFIDGKRGTGKTTLMTTLVQWLHSGRNSEPAVQDELHQEVLSLAAELRDRVILLEPLDMEPLPRGTPIIAAILARLNQAVRRLVSPPDSPRGLLDDGLSDDREYIRLSQFQARIARALESNLEQRRGSLDSEQFGQAILEQEDDRLELVPSLNEVLFHLSSALNQRHRVPRSSRYRDEDQRRHLFLVSIDDVDLNPVRCTDLLRLLRSYSPPQLFFLLMGQFDLVESIMKLQIHSEYQRVRGSSSGFMPVDEGVLSRQIAEVSAANVRKLIPTPQIIKLPEMRVDNVFDFKPLPRINAEQSSEELPTLGELFERIPIQDISGSGPSSTTNLKSLLQGTAGLPDTAEDFLIGQYPALGAFQLPIRRLVDLWTELKELLDAELAEPAHFREKLLGIFKRFWEQVVDEDPLLAANDKIRLKREGPDACEVVPLAKSTVRELPIEDALVRIDEGVGEQKETIEYQPRIRIAANSPGSGVPQLALCTPSSGTGTESRTYIETARTRCAYVLLCDLMVALDEHRDQGRKSPLLASVTPVAMVWSAGEQSPAVINWPLPVTRSFAEMALFQQRIHAAAKALEQIASTGGPTRRQAPKTAIEALIKRWIFHGQLPSGFVSAGGEPSWNAILGELASRSRSGDRQLIEWLVRCALVVMPEACGFDLGTRPRVDLSNLPDELSKDIAAIEAALKAKEKELANRRTQQLDPIWAAGQYNLWHELNSRANEQSWIPIRAKRRDATEKVDVSADVQKLRREFQQSQVRSLIQQGRAALATSPETAKVYFQQARDVANELIDSGPEDTAVELLCSSAWLGLGDACFRSHERKSAIDAYEQALRIIERLREKAPDDKPISSELSVIYNRLGDVYLQLNQREKALAAYQSAFEIRERLAAKYPTDEEAQRDLSVSYEKLGDTYLESNQRENALAAYQSAFAIRRRLADQSPDNTKVLRALSVSHIRLGDLYLDLGQREQALADYEAGFRIAERLAEEDPEDGRAQRELCMAHIRLGDINLQLNRREKSLAEYQTAFTIAQQLATAEPKNKQAQRELSIVYNKLGDIYLQLNQREKALSAYNMDFRIAQRLAQEDPDSVEAQRDLAISHTNLGDVYLSLKQYEKALSNYESAHEIRQRLADDDPKNSRFQQELADSYVSLGDIYLRISRPSRALSAYEEALRIRQYLSKAEPDNRQLDRDVALAIKKVGDAYTRLRQTDKAREAYQRSLEILEPLVQADPEYSVRQLQLAEVQAKLSQLVESPAEQQKLQENAWNILVRERERNAYFYPEIADVERDLRRQFGRKARRLPRKTVKKKR